MLFLAMVAAALAAPQLGEWQCPLRLLEGGELTTEYDLQIATFAVTATGLPIHAIPQEYLLLVYNTMSKTRWCRLRPAGSS